MASARQVWEFSQAFLADRDGYVTVLKIFMDETGVHDDADMVAVGAYIAQPKVWRAWTKDWNQAKRPINVFHATDCAGFFGEFEGWNKDVNRRDSFVAKLLPVISAHGMAGIVIGIQLKEFAAALKGHPEILEMFGTPYTACFQWAISVITEFATNFGKSERMAFVHEVNDYKGEVFKAFDFVKEYLNPRSIPMTLAFGSKEDYTPLQAADVLAYEGGKFLKNPFGTPRRAWTAIDPEKKLVSARRYAEGNMAQLISLTTAYREKLMAQGWDGMAGLRRSS